MLSDEPHGAWAGLCRYALSLEQGAGSENHLARIGLGDCHWCFREQRFPSLCLLAVLLGRPTAKLSSVLLFETTHLSSEVSGCCTSTWCVWHWWTVGASFVVQLTLVQTLVGYHSHFLLPTPPPSSSCSLLLQDHHGDRLVGVYHQEQNAPFLQGKDQNCPVPRWVPMENRQDKSLSPHCHSLWEVSVSFL